MSGPWADRVATRWTAAYTRGLASEIAARRREEIASDLFEQHAVMGRGRAQQCNVLGRVLWGIPADLSWRRAARASHRRLETGAPMKLQRVTTAVVGFLVLFELWAAAGAMTADGGGLWYSLPFVVAAALLCVGLAQRTTAPRRATFLIIIGAAAPVVIFYWMAPIFVPGFLLVSALVVVAQLRRPPVSPAV